MAQFAGLGLSLGSNPWARDFWCQMFLATDVKLQSSGSTTRSCKLRLDGDRPH